MPVGKYGDVHGRRGEKGPARRRNRFGISIVLVADWLIHFNSSQCLTRICVPVGVSTLFCVDEINVTRYVSHASPF